jgi:type I restriction enzyme S subunit
LDAADALKLKDQELLKKYDELAQAIFIDMFGDPVKNEKGWEVKKLGNLFSSPVKCGPFGSALKKEEYVNDGIPVWIMDNIQDYNFNENGCLYINEDKYLDLTSYSALKGDIIISRAGTVGKMCVLDSEFKSSIISTNLIKISLNEKVLNPYFFVKLMKYFGKKIGRLRTGSENGFTHMNTGVLAGLEFPLPTIPKQNEYINVLKNINYQIQFLGTNPENLFQALIQKAFKGELVAE